MSAKTALRIAGYKFREKENDFIRADGVVGRFHANILDTKTVDIHYDLFVDNKHHVPDAPIHDREERLRIMKKIGRFWFREISEKEFLMLLEKW